MTNPRYVVAAITALAAGALTLGLSGIASAGTLPTTGNTITMTISNDTEQTIHLEGADNPYGQWMQSPRQSLAPHETEIVTAYNQDPRGLTVGLVYSTPGGGQAVFMANDYPQFDTDGTRTTDPDHYFISSYIDGYYPNLSVGYHLSAV
ncbi:MAG: hypothetical protein K0Q46_1950 [Rhodococcus erythropolis]|jgi:hypothetical protein|nr:hypothetical protein [Rhodococcus erythropolis]MCD2153137.1 hypothetical protein [Rhodococcus cerastii]MDF2895164.1 hypothetical protein [Rhodococcus erythropolis]